MSRPIRKSNPHLIALIDDLKGAAREHEAPIWRDVALRLARPRRVWAEVNLSRLERHASDGEVLVIPGKLLGTGRLTKALWISAFQSSAAAQSRVEAAGGQLVDLRELVKENPRGSGVRIMG
ncbi:MAG: 50S ribosomal protein L18e [Thermoplasmata archaeon]|nr:50S ribosomal protein L18e [Thermoplasmata archaeon]